MKTLVTYEQLESAVAEGIVSKRLHPSCPLAIYSYTKEAYFDKHWNEVTTAARGIIINEGHPDKPIIGHPFPKFFNIGESEETKLENLPSGNPIIEEKFNGYLAIVFWNHYTGNWDCATKGSFTSDHCDYTRELMKQYTWNEPDTTSKACVTFLFEGVHYKDPHGIRYASDFLGLIGGYFKIGYEWVESDSTTLDTIAAAIGCPRPKRYTMTVQDAIVLAKDKSNQVEGYVLVWESPGQETFRTKLKTSWYLTARWVRYNFQKSNMVEKLGKDGKVNVSAIDFVVLDEEFQKTIRSNIATVENDYACYMAELGQRKLELMSLFPDNFRKDFYMGVHSAEDVLAYNWNMKRLHRHITSKMLESYKNERIEINALEIF